jgi:uncharacterized membrane protein YukC
MPLLIINQTTHFQNKMTTNQATFTIKYQIPYPTAPLLEEWRTQTFDNKLQAEKMIKFYKECGSPASFI